MRWLRHDAPLSSCLSASGAARSMAKVVAIAECAADSNTYVRACELATGTGDVGKVHAAGHWESPTARQHIASALDARLASALRPTFEWYYCRGAFFHNDAHYDARLFGIWYIKGPPMQLVFPRASLRLDIARSSVVVFDPFEVHGVLAPGSLIYSASDYQKVPASVFVGFELDISTDVADAFDIDDDLSGQIISSGTRVDPASGAIRASSSD